MNFDYYTLKKAEREGMRLGNWNGKAVFAASSGNLENLGSGAYYILYDDDNKIVARAGRGWKSYGEVSQQGNVEEYGAPRNYSVAEEVPAAKPSYSEASGSKKTYDEPVGDVKLEIDVEATLKAARTMTIDDLLAGFDYGLDVAKG